MSIVLGFLLKILSSGAVERALDYMDKKAALEGDTQKLKAEVTQAYIRASIDEMRIAAQVQKSKFTYGWYWLFAAFFIAPLAVWWCAVILDSIFTFSWSVSALPRPLDEWAGLMIAFIFGGGTTAMVARAVGR